MLLMLVLLALVVRPARGAGGSVNAMVCMDNLRRLAAAWLLYAQDNSGRFVGNYTGGFVPTPGGKDRPWAIGWLDWTLASDSTNTIYLTDIRYAALATYLGKDTTVFKCPEDQYLSRLQLSRGWPARVRSYSMNCYVGEGNAAAGPFDSRYPAVSQLAGFRALPPQSTFVFTEEHPDSINDPMLYVSMSEWRWTDLPGSFHEGAGGFAFADGHVELHVWRSATTLKPTVFTYNNNSPASPNDPDLAWVRARTTAP
jgi:prepilin-type processing-associated H-X9-DG protein